MVNYFIKKSVVTICLNLTILLIGYFSFPHIANEFIPAIDIPAVAVIVPNTYLSPQSVSQNYIEPVEKKLLATGDVEKIETTIEHDKTLLFIFYKWSLSPEDCLQRARQVVSSLRRPDGLLEPIFILHRPTMSPIFRVVFHGQNVSKMTDELNSLKGEVERIKGVGEVRLQGAAEKQVLIQVDPLKSAQFGVAPSDILASAHQLWGIRHLFGETLNNNIPAYIQFDLSHQKSYRDLPVKSKSGKWIPLKRFSTISTDRESASVIFNKDKDGLILEVIKAPGSDAISIVKKVQSLMSSRLIGKTNLSHQIIYNEAEKIKEAQKGVLQNFAIGVSLNSIILIIFLGSIIGAIVASCVFPTAILGTLYVMKTGDISLNIFALNGFSLASGMITDSSIVVLESIMSRFQKGQELISACAKGTKDVMLGVFASVLTTAAVIIPINMQSGVSSKLFSDLGIVLVVTQFICLIAVFTFVPWLCSKVLKRNARRNMVVDQLFSGSSFLVNAMLKLAKTTLHGSIHNRVLRWGLPGVVTAMSAAMLVLLPNSEFLPTVASKVYSLSIPIQRKELSLQGKTIQSHLSQTIGSSKSVEWVITQRTMDTVNALFQVAHPNDVDQILNEISKQLDQPIQKILATPVGPTPGGEPMGYDGYFYIKKSLSQSKRQLLIDKFCHSPGILDCTTGHHYLEPKIILRPLPLQLSRANTNIFESTFNVAALTRDIDLASLANLPLSIPLKLIFPETSRVFDHPVFSHQHKNSIRPLQSFYQKKYDMDYSSIFRKNSEEYLPLYFRIGGITIGEGVNQFWKAADELSISNSNFTVMGGIETMYETFDKMIGALVVAGILILVILIIQFKSVAQALIIMYSMPLSLGGAIAGLLLLGETLNVGVIVGFILLVGIIVNNGILLMDAINQRLTSGMSVINAVQDSVESRTRPILMTTFSTVFGMLPTLLLEAEGKELYQGMAIVNVFGMIFGTFLTLVVTPIVIRSFLAMKYEKIKSQEIKT